MLVHASDEAALHPQDQMQMTGEVAVILSEKPEWRARADWYHGFAPTSPSKPEELHVGEKPGESSWRGRSTASCVHPPRHSCLPSTKFQQASKAGNALQTQATTP
jgi:hypothetical protein